MHTVLVAAERRTPQAAFIKTKDLFPNVALAMIFDDIAPGESSGEAFLILPCVQRNASSHHHLGPHNG
jgi:hypothetical protein